MRIAAILLGSLVGQAAWAADARGAQLFETKVLPGLKKECFACHNNQLRTSGLSVLSREALLTGGNRGAAIIPGEGSKSLLIQALEQRGELKMPPGKKLPPDVIAAMTEWLNRGAEWTAPVP